jgi:hypothetical protein
MSMGGGIFIYRSRGNDKAGLGIGGAWISGRALPSVTPTGTRDADLVWVGTTKSGLTGQRVVYDISLQVGGTVGRSTGDAVLNSNESSKNDISRYF